MKTDSRIRTRIDLGLELLARRSARGRCYTLKEIAAWCDCSLVNIGNIERKALAKLRRRVAALRGEVMQ